MGAFSASSAEHPIHQSFIDSGAGQIMIACGEAFIPGETRSCSIEVEGVAGNLKIRMVGTAEVMVH